jgi:hypothetical protein
MKASTVTAIAIVLSLTGCISSGYDSMDDCLAVNDACHEAAFDGRYYKGHGIDLDSPAAAAWAVGLGALMQSGAFAPYQPPLGSSGNPIYVHPYYGY